jgi:hypothetical protein
VPQRPGLREPYVRAERLFFEEQGDVVIAGRGLIGVMEKGVGQGVNRGRKRA